MEDAILAEINFARAYPQEYARRLEREPVTRWEQALIDAGEPADHAAYIEAVQFLKRQRPLPPLRPDDSLASAALEHVSLQGPVGAIGHASADGERFYDRVRRHGAAPAMAAENIAYGPPSPEDVVRALIIDSGVPDRGHRTNMFTAAFKVAGVSCGPHRDYETMCVMDFSAAASPRIITAQLDRILAADE
ncbi:CAP domain-containing protein [Phenylobacterium sp. NIBR 498073]|uniref:CAP domain-containing protein n=1 Tax=Phenylobacterium sp. NIBR 498073 TaxID=3015177 RepID=UPI0022B534D6|nr:CAP domain-containing protein [Phenylobacterium sp. NIBR 498073]WGU38180.1 CAP domain-containing protein [Phenylobacterium sp. NIBR 498073]